MHDARKGGRPCAQRRWQGPLVRCMSAYRPGDAVTVGRVKGRGERRGDSSSPVNEAPCAIDLKTPRG